MLQIGERVAGVCGTLLGKGGEPAESLWIRILYVHFRSVNSSWVLYALMCFLLRFQLQ